METTTPTVEKDHGAYALATVADLPECAGDVLGRLYYVEETKEFQVCKSTGWEVIDLKGKDGMDGRDGLDGHDGENASIEVVASTVNCSKIFGGVYFKYRIVTFSDGSKQVICAAEDGMYSSSGIITYLSTQVGATSEYCSFTLDLENYSGGWWKFENVSGTRTATYNDIASASDNTTITFAESDCSISTTP